MVSTTAEGNGDELLRWSTKATWTKGSTTSSDARGVRSGLCSLEQWLGSALACWRRGERGSAPMEEGAASCPPGLPKREVKGGDKEEATPMDTALK
jgi:hypothetical protein